MTDQNHKVSHQLVILAVQEEVSSRVMETLDNIWQKVKSMKKADRTIRFGA